MKCLACVQLYVAHSRACKPSGLFVLFGDGLKKCCTLNWAPQLMLVANEYFYTNNYKTATSLKQQEFWALGSCIWRIWKRKNWIQLTWQKRGLLTWILALTRAEIIPNCLGCLCTIHLWWSPLSKDWFQQLIINGINIF